MITWSDRVAFVGMIVKDIPKYKRQNESKFDYWQHKVKVYIPNGYCSYGYGNTLNEAIWDAVAPMPMDWFSIERKITEHQWQKMSHL